jgi:hypothetical protein
MDVGIENTWLRAFNPHPIQFKINNPNYLQCINPIQSNYNPNWSIGLGGELWYSSHHLIILLS